MPTYSYRCRDCDTAFDIQQSFSDDSLTVCPTCGGSLRKVFSPVGVTFNGSGFYRTDSRAGQSAGGSSSSSGDSGSSSSAGSGSGASSSPSTSNGSGSSGGGSSSTPAKAPAASGS